MVTVRIGRAARVVAPAGLVLLLVLTAAARGQTGTPRGSDAFEDVPAGHYADEPIGWAVARGITLGKSATEFGPDDRLTRAHVVTFLYRALGSDWEAGAPDAGRPQSAVARGSQAFDDVAVGHYADEAIGWAYSQGVSLGRSSDRFGPDDVLSRADAVDLLYSALGAEWSARAPAGTGPSRSEGAGAGDDVSVVLSAAATQSGTALDLMIEFSEPVVGFTVDDLRVSNGVASSFGGSGAVYSARVTRAAPGTIVVRIPRGAALGRATGAASASPAPLVAARPVSDTGWGLDTWDRDLVLAGYLAEFGREEPEAEFTGDVAACVAGTTSQRYRDSVFQRVNWYRRMAGLATTVTENRAYSSAAQQASLMMVAEGDLSHDPGPGWACYTPEGDHAAGKSNLALGNAGLDAIDAYMADGGSNNRAVGHRRWILSRFAYQMGTGDTLFEGGRSWLASAGPVGPANALYVIGEDMWSSWADVREERYFVSWPPPGFVPAETVFPRWSLQIAQADFSSASVQVLDDEGPVELRVIYSSRGSSLPEQTIVWEMNGDTHRWFDEPTDGDHCYDITVSGVKHNGDVQEPYEYATCILDTDWTAPEANSPSESTGAPRGSDTFDDVAAGHHADEAIGWAVEQGVTTGVTATEFGPASPLARAHIIAFLYRALGPDWSVPVPG